MKECELIIGGHTFGLILVALWETIGTLSKNDDDGSEKVAKKMIAFFQT